MGSGIMEVIIGDITTVDTEAIVCAANNQRGCQIKRTRERLLVRLSQRELVRVAAGRLDSEV